MSRICRECFHFNESDAKCLRDKVVDLVYGVWITGDVYDAISERYPTPETTAKIFSIVSNYTGPFNTEGLYFKPKQ